MIKKSIIALTCLLATPLVHAFESFEVKDIRLDGLQRISVGTVFNYLPVRIGDVVDEERSVVAIRDLFKTGFFKDVRLEREGNILVVTVAERPAISEIKFTGNKDIDSEQLTEGLKQIGLANGRTFDVSLLDKVEQELQRQYFSRGKYGVKITSKVTELERNRVDINIDIAEGSVASIAKINITGNNAFSDEELIERLQLGEPGSLNPFSSRDQYSKQKLSADLETIKSYYLDRGYVNFNIESTQVTITPDRQYVYITINVFEGDKFSIKSVSLAGDLVVPEKQLTELLQVKSGEVFSRRKITASSNAISERLGEEGYAFANINPVPDIDNEKREVALTFFVDPGKRIYVRRINIDGNSQTKDEVIRREFRQFEGGWLGTALVNRSRDRLMRLGYFESVNVETPVVAGVEDQVDVNVVVKERSTGSLQAGVGYSESQGVMFTASITHDNFFGTGKRVSGEINTGEVNTIYKFSYTNPYYTQDGVSRTINGFYRTTESGARNTAAYDADTYGAGMSFGFPMSEFYRLRLGMGFESTEIRQRNDTPDAYTSFLDNNLDRDWYSDGSDADDSSDDLYKYDFNLVKVSTGWTYDSRDKAIFPTKGNQHSIDYEVTVPSSDLNFYKIDTRHNWYMPLTEGWTFALGGQIGYGEGFGDTTSLPFFENYYAGGVRTVRGFRSSTLGPKEGSDPLGGAFKTVANAEIFFPVPFNPEATSLRLGMFYDLGSVFAKASDFESGELRSSTGLSATWLSPIGPMAFSFARPIKIQHDDKDEFFQFTLGGTF